MPEPDLPHGDAQGDDHDFRERKSDAAGRKGAPGASPLLAFVAPLPRSLVRTLAQSRNDLYEAFEKIYPVLSQFRKVESAAFVVPPPPAQITGGAA